MLSNQRLQAILTKLRRVPHVEVIRIHTRMPCVQPQRIDASLAQMLGKFHPLFVVVHFNHPREVTAEAKQAFDHLIDAGISLANQSVLLKGVNDNPKIIKELCLQLLKNRVRPYYLHQADLVHGTNHFRTRVETGLQIMQSLRGQISGLAIPHYVIDCPGGGGKIPLLPDDGQQVLEHEVKLKNYEGHIQTYPQVSVETDPTKSPNPHHTRLQGGYEAPVPNAELPLELEQNPYPNPDETVLLETAILEKDTTVSMQEASIDSENEDETNTSGTINEPTVDENPTTNEDLTPHQPSVKNENLPGDENSTTSEDLVVDEDPFVLGQHHEKEEQYLKALTFYQQAIDQNNEEGIEGIERIFAKVFSKNEQLKLLKEGIRNSVTECYYHLAKFYEAQQDLPNALMAIRQYNKLTRKKYKKGPALVEKIFSQM